MPFILQQEAEQALEGLCNILPSSISSTVGALECYGVVEHDDQFHCKIYIFVPFMHICTLITWCAHTHTHTHTHTRTKCDSLVQQYFPLIWQLVQSEFVSTDCLLKH